MTDTIARFPIVGHRFEFGFCSELGGFVDRTTLRCAMDWTHQALYSNVPSKSSGAPRRGYRAGKRTMENREPTTDNRAMTEAVVRLSVVSCRF